MRDRSDERLSRRQLLRGVSAITAAAALTANSSSAFALCSAPPVAHLGSPPYPVLTPAFTGSGAFRIKEMIAGIRPNRIGGVRLERMPALGSGPNRRFLIHNYGHSGAGITLSFGCASVAADHVRDIIAELHLPAKSVPVAVVGSGIIGLTMADELKRRWKDVPVTIYAKDVELAKTCSWVAGGQFEPSGAWRNYTPRSRTELDTFLRRSRDRVVRLITDGKGSTYGLARRKNYTLRWGSDGFDQGTPRDVVSCPKLGPLPFARLNETGLEYQTWLVNPRILMPQLVRDLNKAGVYRRTLRIDYLSEFYSKLTERIIINCTGLGAGDIVNDRFVQPVRGQIAILENPNPDRLNYFFSGGCGNDITYVFCRQNDIVVGGTWESGQTQAVANPQTIGTILNRAGMIFRGGTAHCLPPTTRPA